MDFMDKIAAIGDADSIRCFRMVGIPTVAISSAEDAAPQLRHMAQSGIRIIICTSLLAADVQSKFPDTFASISPALTVLPDETQPDGFGARLLSDAVRRAMGYDINGEGM